MAERTEGTIEIAATPEQVMAVITDFEAYPKWAGVETADVLTVYEDDDLPAEVAMSVSQMGVDAAYTLAYEYGEDPTSVSWTTVEASGSSTYSPCTSRTAPEASTVVHETLFGSSP